MPDGESGVPESPPRSLAPLLRAGALTLLVALLAGVAVRTPLLCRPLGLCAAVPSGGARESSPSEKALKAGEAALKTMRSVGSLGAYQKALADLDNQLLRLSGDSLDADQQARRQRLQEASREGQARLKQERSQADVVSQAAERIDGMAGQPGGAAESDRSEIRRSLESVPAQSFSHGEARTQLRRLEAAPAATAPPEPEAPAAESPAPPAAPEAAPAPPPAPAPRYEGGGGGWQRGSGGGGWSGGGSGGGGGGGWSGGSRSAPAPAPAPAPPADAGGSDAPYRDEPLF